METFENSLFLKDSVIDPFNTKCLTPCQYYSQHQKKAFTSYVRAKHSLKNNSKILHLKGAKYVREITIYSDITRCYFISNFQTDTLNILNRSMSCLFC